MMSILRVLAVRRFNCVDVLTVCIVTVLAEHLAGSPWRWLAYIAGIISGVLISLVVERSVGYTSVAMFRVKS